MESPLNVGDTTTNSIQNLLSETHLNTSFSSSRINSAVYSGHKVIQLSLDVGRASGMALAQALAQALALARASARAKGDDGKISTAAKKVVILRRVQDSFVNVSQMLSILTEMGYFSLTQMKNFLSNEVIHNPQYASGELLVAQYNDWRRQEVKRLRGLWIPYDKAVSLALKFDIYELVKKLFLIDVHDYEELPRVVYGAGEAQLDQDLEQDSDNNNGGENDNEYDNGENGTRDMGLSGSPKKRRKVSMMELTNMEDRDDGITRVPHNPNTPFALSPLVLNEEKVELSSDIKQKFSEIFKRDNSSSLTFDEIRRSFGDILDKQGRGESVEFVTDITLDQSGNTALHFASALASLKLVASFVKLGLCSPIRGNFAGELPLISAITVTNSMEKGNLPELLDKWLWPDLTLYDNKGWTIFHHLVSQIPKKIESSRYYTVKILEWVVSHETGKAAGILAKLTSNLVNAKDHDDGNTCLHLAIEHEDAWFIRILLALKADVNIANKMGVKPIDFDLVKEIIADKRPEGRFDGEKIDDGYIFELISTGVSILGKKAQFGIDGDLDVEMETRVPSTVKNESCDNNFTSNMIYQSIQDLLAKTNTEYESIIKSKNDQVQVLNEALHETTIVTANNRFVANKISEKLVSLENLKVQISNMNDKLQVLQRDPAADLKLVEDDAKPIDPDEPYIIQPIYSKLVAEEDIDVLQGDKEVMRQLPPVEVLKARVRAYEEVNNNMENELKALTDYSELTSKFKKVVSFCTGVDINEVDELLDGLLEAVESQQ